MTPPQDGPRLPDVDRLLDAAGPLPADRPRYDLDAGRQHLADAIAVRRAGRAGTCPGAATGIGNCLAPPPLPGSADIRADAGRDLRTLDTVVINEPGAWEEIESLVTDWEPHGALIFGCLLDLSDRHHSATWWWQFAAGAGSHLAAYCMYLHHLRRGELRDAENWFTQTACLENGTSAPLAPKLPNLPGYARLASRLAPPLPDSTGLPRPDRALQDAINGLPREDEAGGLLSLPTDAIADRLQELASH
ncbi:hypothetical protein ACIQ9P_07565 [Kitasatospora sp. NPDC094019]|uniref:hypothetical protein n=1 Tax=Kitasatospora sp. NPDC094019 TaxID=3364091 RepID=UPI0037F23C70